MVVFRDNGEGRMECKHANPEEMAESKKQQEEEDKELGINHALAAGDASEVIDLDDEEVTLELNLNVFFCAGDSLRPSQISEPLDQWLLSFDQWRCQWSLMLHSFKK